MFEKPTKKKHYGFPKHWTLCVLNFISVLTEAPKLVLEPDVHISIIMAFLLLGKKNIICFSFPGTEGTVRDGRAGSSSSWLLDSLELGCLRQTIQANPGGSRVRRFGLFPLYAVHPPSRLDIWNSFQTFFILLVNRHALVLGFQSPTVHFIQGRKAET